MVVESSDALQICDAVVSQSYFWLICRSSDSTWQLVSPIDSEPKYTTDHYQVLQPDDAIKINTTLPSRPDSTSSIGY